MPVLYRQHRINAAGIVHISNYIKRTTLKLMIAANLVVLKYARYLSTCSTWHTKQVDIIQFPLVLKAYHPRTVLSCCCCWCREWMNLNVYVRGTHWPPFQVTSCNWRNLISHWSHDYTDIQVSTLHSTCSMAYSRWLNRTELRLGEVARHSSCCCDQHFDSTVWSGGCVHECYRWTCFVSQHTLLWMVMDIFTNFYYTYIYYR